MEGERSPPAQPSSHIGLSPLDARVGSSTSLRFARGRGVPSLNSRSPAGRVSSVSTRSGCIFCFQRCTWGFASRVVRKFLGTPAFVSSPLWRAVGRNIARRSQNGESNQMRFAITNLRLDSARLPRATPTRKACGWAPHLASLQVSFRCLLSHLPRAARTCDPELPKK